MNARILLIAGVSIAILAGAGFVSRVTNQSAPTVTPQELIAGFARPAIVQALYDGNLSELNKDRVRNFLYINVLIETTSSQEAFYRMEKAELLIDPQLKVIASGKLATNSDIQSYLMNIGINTGLSILGEFLKSRRDSNEAKTINPINEITSFNRGLLNGSSDIALLKADADYDAKKLMFLAPADPASFNRIYATIRQFVRHF